MGKKLEKFREQKQKKVVIDTKLSPRDSIGNKLLNITQKTFDGRLSWDQLMNELDYIINDIIQERDKELNPPEGH